MSVSCAFGYNAVDVNKSLGKTATIDKYTVSLRVISEILNTHSLNTVDSAEKIKKKLVVVRNMWVSLRGLQILKIGS